MILLLPIAVAVGLMGLGASLYVWVQCASIEPVPAIIMCIVTVIVFGLLTIWGVLKAKKADRPYYLISIGIMFVVGGLLLAFQGQIVDFYGSLFA